MNERGINWRQTTVAKTEKADRPVLFVEAVALSRILGRSIDEFLTETGPLDELVDQLRNEIAQLGHELDALRRRALTFDERLQATRVNHQMALTVVQYANDADSGPLLEGIQQIVKAYRHHVFHAERVYELLQISVDDLREVDGRALQEAILCEDRYIRSLTEQELMDQTGAYLNAVTGYLSGKEVSEEFLAFMRGSDAWASYLALYLTDLVIDNIGNVRN